MALLVLRYGQSLESAWHFTLREFMMIVDLKKLLVESGMNAMTPEHLSDLEAHLRETGAL